MNQYNNNNNSNHTPPKSATDSEKCMQLINNVKRITSYAASLQRSEKTAHILNAMQRAEQSEFKILRQANEVFTKEMYSRGFDKGIEALNQMISDSKADLVKSFNFSYGNNVTADFASSNWKSLNPFIRSAILTEEYGVSVYKADDMVDCTYEQLPARIRDGLLNFFEADYFETENSKTTSDQ